MGVIPAGTLLKTEFSAIIPDSRVPGGDKMGVSKDVAVFLSQDGNYFSYRGNCTASGLDSASHTTQELILYMYMCMPVYVFTQAHAEAMLLILVCSAT